MTDTKHLLTLALLGGHRSAAFPPATCEQLVEKLRGTRVSPRHLSLVLGEASLLVGEGCDSFLFMDSNGNKLDLSIDESVL